MGLRHQGPTAYLEPTMPEHDPATILLTHNKWANTQIMNACIR
ncbi:MAG: hypothetical protein R3B46_06415 [Phycisphaerales bacterium]